MEDGLFSKIRNGIKDMCYIWAKEMRSTITDEGVLIFFILVPILCSIHGYTTMRLSAMFLWRL